MKVSTDQKFPAQWKYGEARFDGRGRKRPIIWTSLILCLIIFPGGSLAQTSADASNPTDLKKLSVEDLMDVEVTSVSLYAENLLDAPSAIQVVTDDDIRRSGASSIPEALRVADNLEVAQKSSTGWGISARGFNTDLANKLLVCPCASWE